jgi:hypothetical protein
MSTGIRLQEIFTRYGEDFRSHHVLSFVQQKTMKAIEDCGTEAMGYHTYYCDHCGHRAITYNSCRNRHCPRCQWTKQQLWIDRVKSQLLPVRYFHVVFTLPESLNPLIILNHGRLYNFLFEAAWYALRQGGCNPVFLGADVGAIAILHTWGQSLSLHPHLHMLVPGGGLDPDGWQWVKSPKKFFVPVKALSKIFRAKYIALLSKAIEENQLVIPSKTSASACIKQLKTLLYKTSWVVYCKKCFAGPGQVITYLGRYTHRVAISESRIIGCDNDKVTFRWKDYRDHNRWKQMSLSADEFIRRFMLHILPLGFYKIRYFGIYAVANRSVKLMQCFYLLGCMPSQPVFAGMDMVLLVLLLTGRQIDRCPVCNQGIMRPLRPPGQWF